MLQRAAHRAHERTTRTRARGARALGAGRWALGAPAWAASAGAACKHRQLLCGARSVPAARPSTGRTVRGPIALLATSLSPATPNTFDYLRVSLSAQNIMCDDTFCKRCGRRHRRLGYTSEQTGSRYKRAWRAGCARRAAASRDAATPKPSKRHGGQRPPQRSDVLPNFSNFISAHFLSKINL